MPGRFLLPLSLSLMLFCSCTGVTHIYFVRHAEKGALPAGDPELTAAGRSRAEALADLLGGEGISAIHSTDTRRTRQTAAPLSQQLNLPVGLYASDTSDRFLFRLLDAEQEAVVVGHSNTVPSMLRSLGLKPSMGQISDDDYDNLFIVTVRPRNGRGGYRLALKERAYGAKSPPAMVGAKGAR